MSESGTSETKGAGGVVLNAAGEVLVLEHEDGSWVFPKGHLDPGESELEAALREVEEEAGVRATPLRPLVKDRTHYRNARGEDRVITWFLLHTQDSPVLREKTFPDGLFLPPEQALARLSFVQDRALLERLLRARSAAQAAAAREAPA